jgi:N-acetylmuramoyl-L-alanine amidase
MSILDQTNLNQYIAEGLRVSDGSLESLGSFSGNTMPEPIRNQIVNLISESLQGIDANIPSNIPSEIYGSVADLMLPFTPSMSKDTLTQVLRSNSVFGQITSGSPDISGILSNQLGSFIGEYENQLREATGSIDAVLGQFGISGGLSQIVEGITGDIKAVVVSGFSSVLSPAELSKVSPEVVATFLKGEGEINILTDLPPSFAPLLATEPSLTSLVADVASPTGVVNLSDLSDSQRNTFAAGYVKAASGTDVSIGTLAAIAAVTSGTIAGTYDSTEKLPAPNPYKIGEETIDPLGSFVASVEELEAEMCRASRGISEVVVHWSETFTNANLSADQLLDLIGAEEMPYHFIIRRDGSIERGIDLDAVGDHCSTNNHNEHSIGVCLIGGLNTATGANNLFEVASARSITRSQYNSLYQFFRSFFNQYPGGQALGHMDIDPNHEDPGFDVRDYVFSNFNKQSLYTNPTEQTALTPTDILESVEGTGSTVFEKDPDIMENTF